MAKNTTTTASAMKGDGPEFRHSAQPVSGGSTRIAALSTARCAFGFSTTRMSAMRPRTIETGFDL